MDTSLDTSHADDVREREITRLIQKRSPKDPDPIEREPSYAESVRRYHERQRREIRSLWYGYHEHMRSLHEGLAREHEEKALALLDTSPGQVRASDRGEGGC